MESRFSPGRIVRLEHYPVFPVQLPFIQVWG